MFDFHEKWNQVPNRCEHKENCECDANVSERKSYRYFVQMCDFFL